MRRSRVRRAPRDSDSYRCYVAAARGSGRHAEAARRLDALARRGLAAALLNLAILEQDRGRGRAEALCRSAIERASETGDARSEILARAGLGGELNRLGRPSEADAEMERAHAAAEATGDPVTRAWVWVEIAGQALARAEYGRARELLVRSEAVAIPDGPPDLQARVLFGLGYLSWVQGDLPEALRFYRRQLAAIQQSGDLYNEAEARLNINLIVDDHSSYEKTRTLLREALAAAVRGNNRGAEAMAHIAVGQWSVAARVYMGTGRYWRSDEPIAHLRKGLELATTSDTRLYAMRCLGWAEFFWVPSIGRRLRAGSTVP